MFRLTALGFLGLKVPACTEYYYIARLCFSSLSFWAGGMDSFSHIKTKMVFRGAEEDWDEAMYDSSTS